MICFKFWNWWKPILKDSNPSQGYGAAVAMEDNPNFIRFADIKCVVFDFGFTLSSDLYFKVAPPEYPHWRDVIQEYIFNESHIVEQWMEGNLTIVNIAEIISRYIHMDIDSIVRTLEKGCERLNFNKAVWDFALAQRNRGKKTALVTANMDVFTKIVVPFHRLDKVFDVILNTFDYQELRKERLWPVAFRYLGNDICYENSLLIEDGTNEPVKFRNLGGYAYQYSTDELFMEWLRFIQWDGYT